MLNLLLFWLKPKFSYLGVLNFLLPSAAPVMWNLLTILGMNTMDPELKIVTIVVAIATIAVSVA
jgi:hypothetical protein